MNLFAEERTMNTDKDLSIRPDDESLIHYISGNGCQVTLSFAIQPSDCLQNALQLMANHVCGKEEAP